MFVMVFAEGIADEEENQRSTNTDDDLVQVEEFYLQRHRGAVSQHAAGHGTNSTGAVGFFPEQAEDQHPEESCFQTAKSEHIDFPDHAGRGNGDKVNAEAQDNGSAHTEKSDCIVADGFALFRALMHVNVFDDCRGGRQQQRRNGRDRSCDGPDDGDAGPERIHSADDSEWCNVVNTAAVSLQGISQYAFGEDADPGGDQGHGADDYSTDDHGVMQGFGIFVADAAYY